MPFGEGSLGRSMGMSGAVGVQNLCLGHMVFFCGSPLEKANFSKFLRYDVGDGTQVKFWVDVWCRDRPLKEVFPDLYNIRTRDASISEVLCYANGRIFWDLQFRCLVNDQESKSLDSCMGLIYSTKVRGVGSDKFSWKPASSRGFVVSGYYHSLSPPTITSFPWKLMWQSKVPPG